MQDSLCPFTWRSDVAGYCYKTLRRTLTCRGPGKWVGGKTKSGAVLFSCIHDAKGKYEWNMQNLTGALSFPTNSFVLSTGVVLQVICCIWLGHFITSMNSTCYRIQFLVASKFPLVKGFAFPLKFLTGFECRMPCVWLHYCIRHSQGRPRDVIWQQIGQYVHRFAIACSCLLWKQWRSRSRWYAEEMRHNISLGLLTAQAPLVLPVLGCMLVRAGKLGRLFSRL